MLMKKSRAIALWMTLSALGPLQAAQEKAVEMEVKQVIIDRHTNAPVVILESRQDKKIVPIWIDIPEARAIAMELEQVPPPRPLTHDLIKNILQNLGATLQKITITEVKNNTYFALMSLKIGGREHELDSRPSDAIAVALKAKAPIYAMPQVISKAQPLPSPGGQEGGEWLRQTMGIHGQDLTPRLAGLLSVAAPEGVLIAHIENGSTAYAAGMRRGDVIVKANEKTVSRVRELKTIVTAIKRPSQLRMEVLRDGKRLPLTVKLPT